MKKKSNFTNLLILISSIVYYIAALILFGIGLYLLDDPASLLLLAIFSLILVKLTEMNASLSFAFEEIRKGEKK